MEKHPCFEQKMMLEEKYTWKICENPIHCDTRKLQEHYVIWEVRIFYISFFVVYGLYVVILRNRQLRHQTRVTPGSSALH